MSKLRGFPVMIVSVGLVLGFGGRSQSAEPMREFLDGLRSRQYFDWALLYLDQLQDQRNLPPEQRAILAYERAMTFSESARHAISPDTQQRQLDQALGFLEQFTKESPTHPLAATANSTRANIILSKARVDILQARLPSNQDNRAEYQDRAREQINRARDVFAKAHAGYKKAWEAFPKFIDMFTDSARYEARSNAEAAYIRAQLDLAHCQFEEAQTYDKGSANHKFFLKKAEEEYRAIHIRYRATVGGLHAQMWEAKCFEEMDDPQRALGIYAELLNHPPESLRSLQNEVRHFRLICLNHDLRRDYAIAVAEGEEWLSKTKPAEQRTQAGQGIRWELVVALEKLADSSSMPPSEKDKALRQAITHLTALTKLAGAYRELAMQKIRDVSLRQRGKSGVSDPKDFDTALALGRDLVKRVGEKKLLFDGASSDKRPREEVEKLRADLLGLVKEQIRVLRLAMNLADGNTPRGDLQQTRYLLAYGYYLLDKPYEAAVAAEAVALSPTRDKQDDQTALDAAYLALAAYIKGMNSIPPNLKSQRDVDVRQMVRLAEFIAGKWPSHPKANESRMLMGRTFGQMEQPRDAAKWFAQVPETAENFPEAQSAAGQSLWQLYLTASLIDDVAQRPAPEELSKWRSDAEKSLKLGVERTQKKIPEAGKTPAELVAAKVTLAEILLSAGQYQPAIDLLDKLPHSVLVAIHVDDQTRRPQPPSIRSARFASHVYQLLLRGRVGLQQLDAAREVMANLEQLAEHSGGADAVTAVYVQLGRELEKELNRLKGAGEQKRFDEVRRSFEEFLDAMYKRPDQNFSSLTWIAETYYGLAQSTGDNKQDSATYFQRAASTYQSILEKSQQDKQFADKDRQAGIRLRLINCRRRQGDFAAAEAVLKILLAERARATDVQFEAAYVWHDQGLAGRTEFFQKALKGGPLSEKDTIHVWGWTDLSLRLQRLVADGKPETKERHGEKLYEAWYNSAVCRQKLGLVQTTTAKKQAELEAAKQVLQTFVQLSGDIPSDWWKKYDRLFRQLQMDLGQDPQPLERPKETVIVAAAPKAAAAKTSVAIAADKADAQAKDAAATKPSSSGSGLAVAVFVLILVGGGGFAAWMIVKGKSRPNLAHFRTSSEGVPFVPQFGEPSAAPVFEMEEFAATPRASERKPAGTRPASSVKTPKGKRPNA